MVGEAYTATRTLGDSATVYAHQKTATATAIEKQDRLLAVFAYRKQFFFQPSAERRGVPLSQLFAHIHDLGNGKRRAAKALGQ